MLGYSYSLGYSSSNSSMLVGRRSADGPEQRGYWTVWGSLARLNKWAHKQKTIANKQKFYSETQWSYTAKNKYTFLAGVYWIYILSLHPSCLMGNFQYTPALEKRMAIHCLSGWIGKYAPLGNLHPSALEITLGQSLGPRGANCLRGRIFQYTPHLGSVYYRTVQ